MSETYRTSELKRASEEAAKYRQQFDTLPKYTPEWREAAEWLNFWQNKAAFLSAVRGDTE